jgi:hypothetical protein
LKHIARIEAQPVCGASGRFLRLPAVSFGRLAAPRAIGGIAEVTFTATFIDTKSGMWCG